MPVLLDKILSDYRLKPYGIHGIPHWCRVIKYGLNLAVETGASRKIVTLFGILHDCQRWDDGIDKDHGLRAAVYIKSLVQENLLNLTQDELQTLSDACEGHTNGLDYSYKPSIDVQVCWDADKLDLFRLGKRIDQRRLFTKEAKQIVQYGDFIPLMRTVDEQASMAYLEKMLKWC